MLSDLQKEKYRKYSYERYWKDPERIRALSRASYKSNPENKIRKRDWMRKNGEKYVEAARKDRKARPYLYLIAKAKNRAKGYEIDFNLTKEWAESRWTGNCELTGAAFIAADGKTGPYSASLDRIDSDKGYTQDNCRFVLWAVNRMKSNDNDELLLEIAELIVKALKK